MEWVETTAKTVEEAKSLALDQLGVADEDAEFEIVEEPRPGLFGRLRGEARVRARVRPTQPRPKVDRRDRRRKPKSESGAAERSPDDRPADAPDTSDATAGADDDTADSGETPARRRSSNSHNRRSSSRPTTEAAPMTTDNDREAPDAAAVGAAAVEFLTGLVTAFEASATVTLHEVDDEMEVRVDGENLGLLVGPKGSTLLAIQDITRVASQRRLGDHQTRLRVDVAGYRVKRREALARFAEKIAAEVVETGDERVLEAMPSADRKVIHDTLSGRSDVVTRSEGEDPRRYVVVAPA